MLAESNDFRMDPLEMSYFGVLEMTQMYAQVPE